MPPTPTAQSAREQTYQLCINWFFYAMTH